MIKLRPVKLNSNWEDEVDEYLPKEPFQEEWNKDFGDNSEYSGYQGFHKYIVPFNVIPKSFLLFLKENFSEASKYFRFYITHVTRLHKIFMSKSIESHLAGPTWIITFKVNPGNTSDIDPEDAMEKAVRDFFKYWESDDRRKHTIRSIWLDLRNCFSRSVPDLVKEYAAQQISAGTSLSAEDWLEEGFASRRLDGFADVPDSIIQMLSDLSSEDLILKQKQVQGISELCEASESEDIQETILHLIRQGLNYQEILSKINEQKEILIDSIYRAQPRR